MTPLLLLLPPPDPAGAEGSVAGLVVYVSIALGVSFLCSVLEAVLLSSSPSYLEVESRSGNAGAKRMLRLKSAGNLDRSISAILTLNTIAHTIGAAGAGAEAAGVFGSEWLGVIGAVLTLLILIVSEIIPKTLGAVHWKKLIGFSGHTTSLLVTVLHPVVWSCQKLTDLMKPAGAEPTVSRAELELLARLGHEEGTIHDRENRVLKNLLRLDKVRAEDIMTPRTVMYSLPEATTVGEATNSPLFFSRIPVHGVNRDEISKFVLRYELLRAANDGQTGKAVAELGRPLENVPESASVATLLDRFLAEQQHMFLVVDEFGGTAGLVTLEDTIEALLGLEIQDETDPTTDMQALAKRRAARRRRSSGDRMPENSGSGAAGTGPEASGAEGTTKPESGAPNS